MPQTFAIFYNRSKHSLKALPSLLHLVFFLAFVLIAVFSFNLEIFRVMRTGDLLVILLALLVGIHWYGQKMQEAGYNDGVKRAHEHSGEHLSRHN